MNESKSLFEPEDKSVNIVIIIITTVVFFIMELWEKSQTNGYFLGNTTEFFLEHGALYAPKLLAGEWYRVITYLFLHSGIEHLMNNMLVLYFLGNALEHYIGKIWYVILYFFSGIIAAMGSVLYNTEYLVCVGASGAVFGLFGALLILTRHIGADTDVPAGDIGVGAREVGYMFGQYKKLRNEWTGTFTGKGLSYGGSLARKEATGFGLCYFADAQLKDNGQSFEGKRVVISGSGNVAIYANQKCTELGGKVIAMCDSSGYIVDESGINLDVIKEIKEVKRERISTYVDYVPTAKYVAGCKGIWTVPCDIALPCATQNELDAESAKALVTNGCIGVFEGANMPCTSEAIAIIKNAGLMYSPGKASNAGGVATSGLEMSQNSERLSWTFEEVDAKLKGIMQGIYKACADAAEKYGMKGDIQAGANIAGFLKVADAMMWQGIC